ncbi:MAG: WYL domain-containing protein, partial [Acidimicrobiia bacterium]
FKLGGAISPMSTGTLVADLGYDLDQLGDLFRAVSQRSRIHFQYRGTKRTVDPYGLVHRFGRWYIVGPQRGTEEAAKVFRADRMTEVKVDDAVAAFTRPDGFDPGTVLASLSEDVEPTKRAEVSFDNDIVAVVLNQFPQSEVLKEGDVTTLVAVPLRSDAAFVSWLIGFDDKAVLEAPPELRTQFIDHVRGSGGE